MKQKIIDKKVCGKIMLNTLGNKIMGVFMVLVLLFMIYIMIDSIHSVTVFRLIQELFGLFLFFSCSLYYFTLYYAFDGEYFVIHYFGITDRIPIKSISYFHHIILCINIYFYSARGTKGPSVLITFCSRKTLKNFLMTLHKKNPSCEIKIQADKEYPIAK
jgi:hypothetical protein